VAINTDLIKERRAEIVSQFGDWTAHNLCLADGVYTYDQTHPKFEEQLIGHGIHLRRIVQIVSDVTNQPLSSLRVLDLACLEGLYGIELARHGAEVVGIEGRQANIEKARFAKAVLALDNLTLAQDDVRNLSAQKYGQFDVVLCLGILYHLDAPDVFQFVEKMSEVCRRVVIIDTHVGIKPNRSFIHNGREYSGWAFLEHGPGLNRKDRLKNAWASLDNDYSLWLTRPTLFNLLADSGFTSVYTCQNPAVPGQWADRETVVALKGDRPELLTTPPLNDMPEKRWDENSQIGLHLSQQTLSLREKLSVRRVLRRGLDFVRRRR
jgi:predicted RNA methylase